LQKKGLPGNAWVGQSDWLVIECDESDGSIVNYLPEIAVLLNIDRDHKELNELLGLFDTFKKNTRGFFITNVDHETSRSLSAGSAFDFGTSPSARVMAGAYRQDGFNISFTINHVPFAIPVPGRHNMENASAASAVALAVGVSLQQSARALASYEGIYRRTQLVGRARGVCVVDDFAHNPAEVVAAIRACQNIAPRVLAWFQPHGYGPLSFMHNELIDGVCGVLRHSDKFYMSDVFYAGGTVVKSVTSEMVVARMRERSANIVYESQRDDIATHMVHAASPGDIVLLMGARDTTLSDFAGYVLRVLES
jgi:UDP-N-acetylmuramate--alanine ligase